MKKDIYEGAVGALEESDNIAEGVAAEGSVFDSQSEEGEEYSRLFDKNDAPEAREDEKEKASSTDPPDDNKGKIEKNKEQDNLRSDKDKLGKFKNPQELLKAYGELEREFTRRSQRLKELENETRPYIGEGEWRQAVDKFFERIPSAKAFARDIAREITEHPELKESRNCLDEALLNVMIAKYRTPEQLMSDGEFLDRHVYGSKAIRDKIIGDYIAELREGKPPRSITEAGLQPVAPAVRPRSIEEAGFMFLKDNK